MVIWLNFNAETTYLDHAGITPYAKSLVAKTMSDLSSHLYGNPHSQSPSSILSSKRIEKARYDMLRFFKADPQHFDLIFVANATAAIKLVADGMRGSCEKGNDKGFWYGYHAAAHTSLVGIREVASVTRYFRSDQEVEEWLAGEEKPSQNEESSLACCNSGLFAYPAQSNMNGRRLPLDWPNRLRYSPRSGPRKVYTLVDAAAYVTTAQLDLSDHIDAPDFVALSFHKIFGFPDLGALIVRKEAGHVLLQRDYFGGGTVDMVINGDVGEAWQAKKVSLPHEALEDGTPAFHSILALEPALEVHRSLYRDMTSISLHTCELSKSLYESLAGMSHGNGVALCRIYKDSSSRYGDPRCQGPTIAFNIQTSRKTWVKKSYVEQLAVTNGIQLRTGGVCNPGGIAWALDLTAQEMKANYSEGLRCGNGLDELNGKPTGIIRISLGAMSNIHDIEVLLAFLRLFLDLYPHNDGAPQVLKKKGPDPVTVTASNKKPSRIRELVAAESNRMPRERSEAKDHQCVCPVVACKLVTQDEAELVAHFQSHRIIGSCRESIRAPPQPEHSTKANRSLKTALKQCWRVLRRERL